MTEPGIGFEVLTSDGAARRGRLSTAHGPVNTPAFSRPLVIDLKLEADVRALTKRVTSLESQVKGLKADLKTVKEVPPRRR